ncbi:hypothetical protein DFH09DRAFT_1246204 [Mycena vulgaris]|nr:hypothetical protein DFH09DRAFT_1246204 [Mycena vulgaris]
MVSLLWLNLLAPVLSAAAKSKSHSNWQKRNKATVQKIYDLTVYPANAKIIAEGSSAVPAGLFNTNATGRVTPVGQFVGFEDSIEYFFGLAPLPSGVPPNGAITNATLVEFTSGCPEVAASTVYLTTSTINADNSTGAFISRCVMSLEVTWYVSCVSTQIAFWHFDADGAVLKYDAWIPSLDLFSSASHGGPGFDPYSPAAMNSTIDGVCGLQAKTCVGNNTVYNGVADCVQTLTAKNFGRLDEAWGDNVACRSIHALLTKLRPEVHCPHVGPTGGGKCIDVAYNDVYFNDQFLFNEPLGSPFNCKDEDDEDY